MPEKMSVEVPQQPDLNPASASDVDIRKPLEMHDNNKQVPPAEMGVNDQQVPAPMDIATSCPFCQMIISDSDALQTHISQHLSHVTRKRKPIKSIKRRESTKFCELCATNHNDLQAYARHMKTLHLIDLPSCKICSKVYANTKELLKHMNQHDPSIRMSCELCFIKFENASELTKHYIEHLGLTSKKCPVCLQVYNSNSTVRKHMKIHSGERKFHCAICQMYFFQEWDVARHVLTISHMKRKANLLEEGKDAVEPQVSQHLMVTARHSYLRLISKPANEKANQLKKQAIKTSFTSTPQSKSPGHSPRRKKAQKKSEDGPSIYFQGAKNKSPNGSESERKKRKRKIVNYAKYDDSTDEEEIDNANSWPNETTSRSTSKVGRLVSASPGCDKVQIEMDIDESPAGVLPTDATAVSSLPPPPPPVSRAVTLHAKDAAPIYQPITIDSQCKTEAHPSNKNIIVVSRPGITMAGLTPHITHSTPSSNNTYFVRPTISGSQHIVRPTPVRVQPSSNFLTNPTPTGLYIARAPAPIQPPAYSTLPPNTLLNGINPISSTGQMSVLDKQPGGHQIFTVCVANPAPAASPSQPPNLTPNPTMVTSPFKVSSGSPSKPTPLILKKENQMKDSLSEVLVKKQPETETLVRRSETNANGRAGVSFGEPITIDSDSEDEITYMPPPMKKPNEIKSEPGLKTSHSEIMMAQVLDDSDLANSPPPTHRPMTSRAPVGNGIKPCIMRDIFDAIEIVDNDLVPITRENKISPKSQSIPQKTNNQLNINIMPKIVSLTSLAKTPDHKSDKTNTNENPNTVKMESLTSGGEIRVDLRGMSEFGGKKLQNLFVCIECGMDFSTQDLLDKHILIHDEEEDQSSVVILQDDGNSVAYMCVSCCQMYQSKELLDKHKNECTEN